MRDLIDRKAAIDAILKQTVCSTKRELVEICDANISDENGWLGGICIALDTIDDLPSAQPEYYDYSDIDPLWKSFAEENDINLTDTAKQLKDAMWCGYRKGKADAQSEPYKEKLNEIASALSEKFAYMNTCLNERDIILGYLGVKRSCETHCHTDCTNTKCESHPLSAQPEQRWIPCSEVPDNDREVFIARGELKSMSVCIGYYDHDYKQWYESRNWFAKCLYDELYWCEIPPLPKSYRGEGDTE